MTDEALEPSRVFEGPSLIRVGPRQSPWSWVFVAVVLVGVALLANLVITNPNFGWNVVASYFFSPAILFGAANTVLLTVVGMVIGVVLGTLAAVARMSSIRILAIVASVYVWFFRGTPLLVQIIFWYNIAALVPRLTVGIPFGPTFFSWDTNQLMTPFMASVIGLGLNEGAYMSEIVRAGIMSVDRGQQEAALTIGLRRGRIFRRIILPQAMRFIVPPTGNQVIGMLKNSALVSVTAFTELLYSAQIIYQANYKTIPLLIVASIWYLIITTCLSVPQYYLERHYARGSSHTLPETPLQRIRSSFRRVVGTPSSKRSA